MLRKVTDLSSERTNRCKSALRERASVTTKSIEGGSRHEGVQTSQMLPCPTVQQYHLKLQIVDAKLSAGRFLEGREKKKRKKKTRGLPPLEGESETRNKGEDRLFAWSAIVRNRIYIERASVASSKRDDATRATGSRFVTRCPCPRAIPIRERFRVSSGEKFPRTCR